MQRTKQTYPITEAISLSSEIIQPMFRDSVPAEYLPAAETVGTWIRSALRRSTAQDLVLKAAKQRQLSRNTIIGSVRHARAAGSQHAMAVARARIAVTRMYIDGSTAATWNRTLRRTLAAEIAASRPMAQPTSNNRMPWRKISPRICPGCAPSASRKAISRRRRSAL
jgi:hypothetical protein